MVQILDKNDLLLRKKSSLVLENDISSKKIKSVIKRMKEALDSQKDGVAIAAPQIGELLRIVIISEKVFGKFRKESKLAENEKRAMDMVLINPVIVKQSKKKVWMEEGCLSVRWLYGKTHRSDKATVRAFDENGKIFTRGGSGLLSQVFQHEVDHLDGILFIDHAKDLEEFDSESSRKEL